MVLMEGLLRRIAGRCSTHDRAWPRVIRDLEDELGMTPSPPTGDLVDNLCDPRLIDCGFAQCRRRRNR